MSEEFNARKKQLRALWKRYKVGLVTDQELTDEEIYLLNKYYGAGMKGYEEEKN